MTRKKLIAELKETVKYLEGIKGPLAFEDISAVAAVFPGGLVGEENDGQLVVYTGFRETKSGLLKELP